MGRAYHRAVIIGVDIGNSAAKAALIDGSTVREAGRLDTSVASTADLTAGLRMLVEKARVPPDSIVAISVVDRWTARLERAAGTLGLPLTVAGADRIPLLTALPRPDLTGPDRLLAAWAASVLHGRPVVVVDLGTATTVDAVDADGFFLGGAILPGLGLAARALAEGTARLPRVELELPDDAIGVDTAAALQSGIVIGHLGAVRELVTRMRERLASQVGLIGAGAIDLPELGPSAPGPPAPGQSPLGSSAPRVVVTGGHAAASWARAAWCRPASPNLPAIADVLDPELVLRGLGLLAEHIATRPGAGAPS
jgi:type III pantothenate kinase